MLVRSSRSFESLPAGSPASEASNPDYAFLVHSQNTLTQNLPPKVDNKMLARQKRRRTSPEDQAILEAEYQKNSKPDKAARAEIVKKVALGEKEVQIWFQNRRQNDRRKSRPLLPHEMIPHLRNSPLSTAFRSHSEEQQCPVPNQQLDSTAPQALSSDSQNSSPSSVPPLPTGERAPSRASSIHDLLNPSPTEQDPRSPDELDETVSGDVGKTGIQNGDGAGLSASQSTPSVITALRPSIALSQELEGSSPQSAQSKKRSFDESNNDKAGAQKPPKTTSHILPTTECHPNVRLSISIDGSVKVKTTNEETPSPPKNRGLVLNVPTATLHKSKSAVFLTRVQQQRAAPRTNTATRTFGRSRDSRRWEFYCDSEARDSLVVQAERERSGSAAGTIGLIRSQSQSKRHGVEEQRNALTPKTITWGSKKNEARHDKPRLSRAMSSLGRIQGNAETKEPKLMQESTFDSSEDSLRVHQRSPSSDSDKENWAPGTRASVNPLRRHRSMNTSKSRAILGENRHIPSRATERDAESRRKRARRRDPDRFTDNPNHKSLLDCDDEVTAFMSGRGDQEEDLDCVQGLLSLSQGAWK